VWRWHRLAAGLLLLVWAVSAQAEEATEEATHRASPGEVREALHAELDEGPYRDTSDPRAMAQVRMTLTRRLLEKVVGWVRGLGGWLSGVTGLGNLTVGPLGTVLLVGVGILVTGLLALLIYLILRTIRGHRVAHLKRAAAAARAVRSDDQELLSLTSRRALLAARRAAESGDYRLGIRYVFFALLLRLSEAGSLDLDLRQTGREYQRQLAAATPERMVYDQVLDVFERKWYGLQEAAGDDYGAVEALVRPLFSAEGGRA